MRPIGYIPFLALALAPLSNGGVTLTQNSSDFAYLYEMDVNPTSQDLDANSTADFFIGTASGLTAPQTYSSGIGSSSQGASPPEILFRTDFGGSVTRNTLSANTPYTIEVTVAKTGGTQGSQGWFSMALQSPGRSDSARFAFKDDRVTFRTTGGTFTEYLTGGDFDSGAQTVRIAYEGFNNYYVWVNDTLLNADLSTPIQGGNGSFNTGGAWFIGDFSGDTGGDWNIDYIRYESGTAYAPVPEPALSLLGALGLTALLRRRR